MKRVVGDEARVVMCFVAILLTGNVKDCNADFINGN